MATNTTVDELESTIDEVTFAALAEEAEYSQLEDPNARLEIGKYGGDTVRIYGLNDGRMTYLVKYHDWSVKTTQGPYVYKRMSQF